MQKIRTNTLFFGLAVVLIYGVAILMIRSAREKASAMSCRNNLKQIGLAMLNYESTHGTLPIGVETDANEIPTRSWRTLLYPMYIEASQQHYDPNLPWDSPNNKRLIDETPVTITDKGGGNPRKISLDPCPCIWRCPSCDTGSKRVNYAVIVGDQTAFPMNRSVKLDEVTDGLENTILVVETLSCSPFWTEPLDIGFETMKFRIDRSSNGEISSCHPDGAHVLFADGKTYFLSSSVSADELHALLTIAGGESVTRQELIDRGILK